MPIVSSQIVEDAPQYDGRRWITEEHTDAQGGKHRRTYMTQANADVEAVMLARVDEIDAQLVEAEMAANESEVLA